MKKPTSLTMVNSKRLQKIAFIILAILVPLVIIGTKLAANTSKLVNEIPTPAILVKPVPKLPWLHTSGRDIVSGSGNRVLLRGVNIASIDWGNPDWNEQAISQAAENWHVNVIRIRVIESDYVKDPQAFFDILEKEFLIPARKNQVYVILHPRVESSNTDLPDQKTVAMWQAIATRYQNDPTVLYDLLAEPHNVSAQTVAASYQPLIQVVRQQNPNSLIFVTGTDWGRQINYYADHPMPYPNIVYRSNPYNSAAEFSGLFGKIEAIAPIFFGEFGANGFPKVSLENTQALIDHAKQFGIGWTAWNFHSIGCPCLLSDYQTFVPSAYGKVVKDALQSQ